MHSDTYFRLKKLTLSEVLPFITDRPRLKPKMNVTDQHKVKVYSVRLRTFKKSTVCAGCGLKGTHFYAERQHHGNTSSFHLNLYATTDSGKEVLMTKDHIIPKSKGGSNGLHNMQTMCIDCNQRKGNGSLVISKYKPFAGPKKLKKTKNNALLWSIKINDFVSKVSRKKFKSGNRVEQVISLKQHKRGTHEALFAKITNCVELVPYACLTNDDKELKLMLTRDNV